MNFSLLTYNVLYNKAFLKLDALIQEYRPDIICLQEINTSRVNLYKLKSRGYILADFANSFIQFGEVYGVATYFKTEKFSLNKSNQVNLSMTLSEIFFTAIQVLMGQRKPKTILKTELLHKKTRKKITIYNTHLIYIATNALRINHIQQALKPFNGDKKSALIVCGDFNYYPYSRGKLEKVMKKYGLIEATKNILPTIKFSKDGKFEHFNFIQRLGIRIINKTSISKRIKTDYVFYKKINLARSKRIEVRHSDHYPILTTFRI